MGHEEQTVAVLFADVCGSTPLYEGSGNLEALDLIADCLENISRVVEAEGGTVLHSKGDDVLCTFPDADSAVRAASQMMDGQAGSPLEIHVGINYGPVVHDRGGIFGDVMQLASDGVISLGLHPKEDGPTMIKFRLGREESHDD